MARVRETDFRFSKGVFHLFLLVFQFNFPLDFSNGGLDVVFRIGDPRTLSF